MENFDEYYNRYRKLPYELKPVEEWATQKGFSNFLELKTRFDNITGYIS